MILPTGQVQHFLGEHVLSLQRHIGTQDVQAGPDSFNTLACGKLDSWTYLGAPVAVLLTGRITSTEAYDTSDTVFHRNTVTNGQLYKNLNTAEKVSK
jgi:hypothetical protein